MQRAGLAVGWLVLALAASLLTFESWLPGQVFVPLTPDDFPAWAEGRDPAELMPHPRPNWSMSDVLHLLLPGLATTRAALDRGELPGWDPSQAGGVPHLDQVHYSVLYPPAWIPVAIGLSGLGVLAWIHVLLAGGGMLLYLTALKRTPVAALTGALAFALSAWVTARLHSFPVVGAAVWLPWVLWGLERGAEARRPRYYAATAVALALSFLAGFPQVSLLVAGTAALMEIARLARGRALRPALLAAVAIAGGALLAAPQLVPTWDFMSHESARADQDVEQLVGESLPYPMLAHLIMPDYFATTRVVGFHPLAMQTLAESGDLAQAQNPVVNNRAETSLGIGTIGFILAVVAMLFGRTWQTRLWTLIVLGTLTLLVWPDALRLALSLVPPLRFGSPRRLLLVTTCGLAVLAAGGVDLVLRQRLRVTVICWSLSLALAGLAIVAMVLVPGAAEGEELDGWARGLARALGQPNLSAADVMSVVPRANFERSAHYAFWSAIIALVFAVSGIVMFHPRSVVGERGWSTRAEGRPWILALLVGLELTVTAIPLLRTAPMFAVSPTPERIGALREPPLATAARRAGGDDRLVPVRIARLGNEPPFLRPNFPGLFGLADIQAYAPMIPRRLAELLAVVAPQAQLSGSKLGGFTDAQQLASPIVDLLGIDVVLTSLPELDVAGLEEAEVVGQVRVLRNAEALPRAFFVTATEVVAESARRRAARAEPGFDPRARVLLGAPVVIPDEVPPALVPPTPPPAPGAESGAAASGSLDAAGDAAVPGDDASVGTGSDGDAPEQPATGDGKAAQAEGGTSEGTTAPAARAPRRNAASAAAATGEREPRGARPGGRRRAAAAGEPGRARREPTRAEHEPADAEHEPAEAENEPAEAENDASVSDSQPAGARTDDGASGEELAGQVPAEDDTGGATTTDATRADGDATDDESGGATDAPATPHAEQDSAPPDVQERAAAAAPGPGVATRDDASVEETGRPPPAGGGDDAGLASTDDGVDAATMTDVVFDTWARDVTLTSYAPGRIDLAVGPGEAGVVVVGETWHPGWRATVNGHDVETVPADHALIGVPLGPGTGTEPSLLTLRFAPASHRIGFVIGGVAWALLLLLLLRPFAWRRSRRLGAAVGWVRARTTPRREATP